MQAAPGAEGVPGQEEMRKQVLLMTGKAGGADAWSEPHRVTRARGHLHFGFSLIPKRNLAPTWQVPCSTAANWENSLA